MVKKGRSRQDLQEYDQEIIQICDKRFEGPASLKKKKKKRRKEKERNKERGSKEQDQTVDYGKR